MKKILIAIFIIFISTACYSQTDLTILGCTKGKDLISIERLKSILGHVGIKLYTSERRKEYSNYSFIPLYETYLMVEAKYRNQAFSLLNSDMDLRANIVSYHLLERIAGFTVSSSLTKYESNKEWKISLENDKRINKEWILDLHNEITTYKDNLCSIYIAKREVNGKFIALEAFIEFNQTLPSDPPLITKQMFRIQYSSIGKCISPILADDLEYKIKK